MQSAADMVKKSQPTLFWCTRSLPRSKREAIYTLFAFCHHLDGIVRSTMPVAEKQELLKQWREELDNIYDKKVPASNIGRKIYKNCMRFNLSKDLWLKILESATLNVPSPLQAPSREDFEKYITGAASVPLYLTLLIINGRQSLANRELAVNLGKLMMITAILRDVKDDAKVDALYFPTDVLKQAQIKIESVRQMVENKNITVAREILAKEIAPTFVKTERLLNKMNRRDTLALRLVYNLNHNQFIFMQKRGWEIISPKPKLGVFGRLRVLYQTMFD